MFTVLLYGVGFILTLVVVIALIGTVVNYFIAAKTYTGPVSDHFNGQTFYNITDATDANRFTDRPSFWKWVLSRPKNTWVWRDSATSTKPVERVMGNDVVVTFVNHATVLVQTQGINILTDPMWSERASPFSFIGPRRYQAPGITFRDLPPIDVVIISHNHYDHMDVPTLRRIIDEWHPRIYVPLANASYLTDRGIEGVEDLDWWQVKQITSTVSISSVAAQHFSSRGITDRNKTLWGGYIIDTPNGQIYIAGDTGYGPFVQEIKKRYTNIRLGFIPIGAFKPEWFMGPVHVSPDEAIQIQQELRIDTVIGMHFGTFHLADDTQDEPALRIKDVLQSLGSSAPDFRVPTNGQQFRFTF